MSRIFEALQRAEAERSGTDLKSLPGGTELLQRTESHATSKRETPALSNHLDMAEITSCETDFDLQSESSVATEDESSAQEEISEKNESLDVFSLFQSHSVSLSPDSRLVCLTDNESPAAEAFRLLGVRLRHLRRNRPLKKVLITSTIPQEGKSLVAANLACALALRTEQRTLLIEGDVRRPSLSQLFRLGRNPGLCECLEGDRSLMMSIYHLESQGLWVLPAGSSPSNPLKLLQSERLTALMDEVCGWFDWVIIDSPPVLPLADTSVWMRLADGVLLVARQGTTLKTHLKRGLDALEPKKVIGAVLNASKSSDDIGYYYRQPAASDLKDSATNDI